MCPLPPTLNGTFITFKGHIFFFPNSTLTSFDLQRSNGVFQWTFNDNSTNACVTIDCDDDDDELMMMVAVIVWVIIDLVLWWEPCMIYVWHCVASEIHTARKNYKFIRSAQRLLSYYLIHYPSIHMYLIQRALEMYTWRFICSWLALYHLYMLWFASTHKFLTMGFVNLELSLFWSYLADFYKHIFFKCSSSS